MRRRRFGGQEMFSDTRPSDEPIARGYENLRPSRLSWRRVHDGFGNVGIESPAEHAEGARHVRRTIRKSCRAQLTSLRPACWLLAVTIGFSTAPAQTLDEFFQRTGAALSAAEQRYGGYWTAHIEKSHRQILQSAKLAKEHSRAVVLGAGSCREIPLEGLAHLFEQVVLVDLDEQSMREAVGRLPSELQDKVEIRVSDITSFARKMMEQVERAVKETRSAEEAFDRLGKIYDAVSDLGESPSLPEADLVVSSLVVAELPRYPRTYADYLVQNKFRVRLSAWTGHDRAQERLRQFAVRDHVTLLSRLSKSGGVVYFADAIARGPVSSKLEVADTQRFWAKLLTVFSQMRVFLTIREDRSRRRAFRGALRAARGGVSAHPIDDEEASVLLETLSTSPESLRGEEAAVAAQAVVNMLCLDHFAVSTEVEILSGLMDSYENTNPDALEYLVPLGQLAAEWKSRGLVETETPVEWWWLGYPCSIPRKPGAFKVRSWTLRRD